MKKVLFYLIPALLLLLTVAALPRESKKGYAIGDTVEAFKLKNVDGKMVGLSDYKDARGMIVVFSCNHCPWVVKYEDRIKDLNKKFDKKGYPVVAINPNDVQKQPEDSFEKMVERSKKLKFDFPYLYDETQHVAAAFGAEKTPHVYLLNNEKGKMVVRYIGAIDDNPDAKGVKEHYVEAAIQALLDGKEVDVKETKAIGCSIKWSAS